jgi:hypothetical protein
VWRLLKTRVDSGDNRFNPVLYWKFNMNLVKNKIGLLFLLALQPISVIAQDEHEKIYLRCKGAGTETFISPAVTDEKKKPGSSNIEIRLNVFPWGMGGSIDFPDDPGTTFFPYKFGRNESGSLLKTVEHRVKNGETYLLKKEELSSTELTFEQRLSLDRITGRFEFDFISKNPPITTILKWKGSCSRVSPKAKF